MNKKVTIVLCAMVVLIGAVYIMWQVGVFDSYTATGHVSNEKFEEVVKSEVLQEVQPVSNTAIEPNDVMIIVRSENAVWDEMHKMANTKIVADEIWGKIDTTTERINKLILEVEKSDFKTKAELLKILYRWKEGDYRQVVIDHNFVWTLLGGTVGEAKDLNEETKKEMEAKYGNN